MRAERAKPARPVAGDQREVGERLGVVDQRRAPAHPALERHRRGQRRLCRAAVTEVDERRLLAGDVARRGRAGSPILSPSPPARSRSVSAPRQRSAGRRAADSSMQRISSSAPTARAASTPPSRRGGAGSRAAGGPCALAGSPSAAFASTIGRLPSDVRPPAAATARSFLATGNAAPPRPSRPACSTSSISAPAPRRSRPCSAYGSSPLVAQVLGQAHRAVRRHPGEQPRQAGGCLIRRTHRLAVAEVV